MVENGKITAKDLDLVGRAIAQLQEMINDYGSRVETFADHTEDMGRALVDLQSQVATWKAQAEAQCAKRFEALRYIQDRGETADFEAFQEAHRGEDHIRCYAEDLQALEDIKTATATTAKYN